MLYLLALLIGVIAGLRAGTALAVTAWGAWLGWLPVAGTWANFMGHWITVGISTILGIVELITDQLPSTPSRTVPIQFGTRILVGAVCGAAVSGGLPGALAGLVGAVIGTFGGRAFRARLAATFGDDRPAAIAEDAIALAAALLVVMSVR